MKRFIVILSSLFMGSLFAQETSSQTVTAERLLNTTIQHLMNDEYEQLHRLFSERMAEKLTPKKMEKTFGGFERQYGAIEKALEFSTEQKAEGIYYRQGIQLEKEKMNVVITLNDLQEISSLYLRPHTPLYFWTAPSYSEADRFFETEITVGDDLPLLGKYTESKVSEKLTVVFVHGSGPNDMDESVGPNKIFKDLAFGLASQGINSIRYNKRSYDYPSKMAQQLNELTIEHVVVNDAVKAIQLAKDKGAEKVILIGHSLGGHMSARIADQIAVDGVITLGGNVSPLEDLLIPQFEYLRANDPESAINDFQFNAVKSQVKRVQDKDFDENTAPPMLPLGLPAAFWLSLQDYNPAKVAKKQTQPYLILNGERDYQVTPAEAKKWKNGNKHQQSKTIIYPKLNHLFFAGEGVCIPSEYEIESHVATEVVEDITQWIKAL